MSHNSQIHLPGGTESRTALRKRLLAARERMRPEERMAASKELAARLWQIKAFGTAACVCIYVSFRSEVATFELITDCLQRGMRVTVPLTHPGQGLSAHEITDPAKDLVPGYCRIPEPSADRSQAVDPKAIDAVLLPGSVFDTRGNRLGYGGGYYDRFLANDAPRAVRIGLCFELQVVERVPVQDHDQPMHHLVTEKRIVTP